MTCRWRHLIVAVITTVGASIPACAAAAPDIAAALEQRLALMRDVAHFKFAHGEPIQDRAREELVLQRMAQRGEALGLTPASTRVLGSAVIAASRSIQTSWHREWQKTGPPATAVPDLANTTRPAIDAASDALLIACALSRLEEQNDDAARDALAARLRALRVDDQQVDAVLQALAGIKRIAPDLARSTLDHVRKRGWLRVGMPGDYAPYAFSSTEPPTRLRGIDVELAADLAAALKVQLQLVPTSWSRLADDLASGEFDIAMGGVTRTLGRQQQGMFSAPYFHDGKSAIARCTNAARFAGLGDIDQPGVVVLANPGGSNEQFVRDTIQHATVKLMPDNLGIFAALIRGEGDVMFTDAAEIRWQTSHNSALCPALAGKTLNKLDKAVFMPRDVALKLYVDLWLEQLADNGKLDAIISRYLP